MAFEGLPTGSVGPLTGSVRPLTGSVRSLTGSVNWVGKVLNWVTEVPNWVSEALNWVSEALNWVSNYAVMMQLHLCNWTVLTAALLFMATSAKTQSCMNPPVIREADKDGSFFINSEPPGLVMHCDSDVPVEWIVQPVLKDHVTVTPSESGNPKKFTSTFELPVPYSEDTGFFTCTEAQSNCSSKIYVFISDGEYDFVNDQELLTVQGSTDDIIIIDCRTTSPQTNVTLYKGDQQVTSGRFRFDHRVGFILSKPFVQDSGTYYCRTNNRLKQSSKSIMLTVDPGTHTKLPVPVIKALPNTHFVVGHPFRLECTVPSTKAVTFTWTHYDEHPTGSKPEKVDNHEKTKKSVYSVESATLQHSGVYQCRVSRLSLASTNNITINILKSKPPLLNMTSEPFVIHVNRSQEVFWKVMVEFYPMIPEVFYYNPRNERVKQSHRINSTFNSVTGESRLQINDVQPSDFGNWTLVAQTDYKTTNTSVKIIVTSAPEVRLIVPSSVRPGPVVGVACEVVAYCLPRRSETPSKPEVFWDIAHCPRLTPGCQWERLDLQTNTTYTAENRFVVEPLVAGTPLSTLDSSVWVQCGASCGDSMDTDKQLLVVTDLSDRWEFRHSDNGKTEILDEFVEKTVVVNDDFELHCGATNLLYNVPTLTYSPNTSNSAVKVYDDYNVTKYSTVVTSDRSIVSEQHAGLYSCSVSEKQGQQRNKTLVISVTGSRHPAQKPMTVMQEDKVASAPPSFNGEVKTPMHDRGFRVLAIISEDEGVYACVMTWRNEKQVASAYYYTEADASAKIRGIVLIVAAVIISLLVVASMCLVHRVLRERAKSRERNAAKLALFQEGKVDQINPELRLDEQAELLPYDLKYEVPRDHILMGRQLGSGAFGRVVKAEVKGLNEHDPERATPVAIKMTKSLSDPSHVKNLGSELKILIHLGKHLNIVNLIGANTERIAKGEIWILVEYCRYGDLLSFVQKYRKRFVNQIDPFNDSVNYNILPLTPNSAALPFSPGMNNNHRTRDRPSQSSMGADGYLVPNSVMPPIVLADPPRGHSARSSATSPNDLRSPSDSVVFFADNPGYGKLEAAVSGSHSPVPPSPLSHSAMESHNSPTATSQILLSPISEDSQEQLPETMPIVTHSPSSPPPYDALNAPTPASPYMNVGVAQSSPASPPPYVSQGFVPPGSPRKLSGEEADTPSYRGSNSYRSGSMGGPYNRINTDMTTVSSQRPFSPGWRDSESCRSTVTNGKGIPGLESPFTTTELLCWSWQVAQGMDYLTKRKVLHGDLAARNLLLADGNVIKISDFGLSRDIYKQNYLKQSDDLLPIKWMSIEAIKDRCFSVESDVWAYGITLWELFSLGMAPYPGVDVNPQFLKSLEEGMRSEQPKFSNKKIYEIMCDCWHEDPELRPSFASIMSRLRPMIPREVLENFDTMNENYLQMNKDYFEKRTDYLNMFLSPEFNNLQRPEQYGHPDYMAFQGMSEEERMKNAIEYQKMMSLPFGSTDDGGGYLSMGVLGGQPPPDTNGIFSPNPVVAPKDTKRFTFHSTEDLVPPTEVSSPSYSSNAPTTYRLVPQSPCETSQLSEESYPRTNDDAQERNSFLHSEDTDENDSYDTSIVEPHYRNYQV
ncbi:Immunoglobulin [Trinorchestia longiramus]|nr:Immunoglobulin [Trinorchestia longiramus]